MGSKTPLYDKHIEAGARVVDFGGWDMPLHYGSQKQEHHAVRNNAGVRPKVQKPGGHDEDFIVQGEEVHATMSFFAAACRAKSTAWRSTVT